MPTYYSHGKLLLTAEYAVLDGAKALALPTKLGQSLHVEDGIGNALHWQSLDKNNSCWFETHIKLDEIADQLKACNDPILHRFLSIIQAVHQLNPNFFNASAGSNVITKLEFDRHWGLGSSSTLINNIANWTNVDAYELLELTFGGSGYDIACAQYDGPIIYQNHNHNRIVEAVTFDPEFSDHLYFVYLNKKRNSQKAIEAYKSVKNNFKREAILKLNSITMAILDCSDFKVYCELIEEHENVISNLIEEASLKQTLFSDFKGTVKSLGAWGGDFIMAASLEDPTYYFNNNGYSTVIPYQEMIL